MSVDYVKYEISNYMPLIWHFSFHGHKLQQFSMFFFLPPPPLLVDLNQEALNHSCRTHS